MRKVMGVAVLAVLALAVGAREVAAQTTAQQNVTFEVAAINQIAITDAGVTLVVNSATAGQAPAAVSATSSYSVTTNEVGKKITAKLETDMPAGLTLTLELAAPTGGASAGAKVLNGSAAEDLVTGISKLNETGLTMTYSLSATAAAGVVPPGNRVVTLTLTDGV